MGGHGISMNPKKEKGDKKNLKKGGKVQKCITSNGLNGNSLMEKSQLTGLASKPELKRM